MALKLSLIVCALSAIPFAGAATTIDFSSLSDGVTVTNQFSGLTFVAGGLTGSASDYMGYPVADTGAHNRWATNTNMVVSATDVGVGVPAGTRVLHTLNGWNFENGVADFTINFATAVSYVSIDFFGDHGTDISSRIAGVGDSGFYAFNGATNLGLSRSGSGDTTSTKVAKTVSFSGSNITSIVVMPGSYADWAGVGSVTYSVAPVPEPCTIGLLVLGGGALLRRRRTN